MADPACDYRVASNWLHAFLEHHEPLVFFDAGVLAALRRSGRCGLDVLFVLKTSGVIWGEPDPSGARWIVEGEDADGRLMRVTLRVDVGMIRVEVVRVATA